MKYKEISFLDAKGLESGFNSGNKANICESILSICMYGKEYNAVMKICKKFLIHKDNEVRISVLRGLSICIFNFKKIDKEILSMVSNISKNDTDVTIKNIAQELIEDIEVIIPSASYNRG